MKLKNKKISSWIAPGMLIVSFLGFLDALYLTIQHYSGGELECNILHGCEVVTTSAFSEIFGVPVALLGVIYYFVIAILVLIYFDRGDVKVLKLASWLTFAGLFASIYFLALQAFVIKAFCQYCIGSAITSTILFVFGMTSLYKMRNINNVDSNKCCKEGIDE